MKLFEFHADFVASLLYSALKCRGSDAPAYRKKIPGGDSCHLTSVAELLE